MSKRLMAWLLAIAMVFSQMSGIGLTVQAEEAAEEAAEEVIEYYFPIGDDKNMLPYWGHDFDNRLEYRVWNDQYDGEQFFTTITSVSVVNAEDDDGEGNVVDVEPWDDGNGWHLQANRYGHAIGTLKYISHNREEEEKTFHIWVGTDVYNLDVTHAYGVNQIIAGERIPLFAYLYHECYNEEEGHFQGSIEDAEYEWSIADENVNEDVLTIEQDKEDPTILYVTAADTTEYMGSGVPIELHVSMPDADNKMYEVANYYFRLQIVDAYYYLEPLSLENTGLAVGETLEVNPELYFRCYRKEMENVTADAKFGFEWDKEAVKITDAEGKVLDDENNYGKAPFTLKKLKNWNTDVKLFAEVKNPDGDYERCCEGNWNFQEINYDIWFDNARGDGHSWIFVNEEGGEEYTLNLNTENLHGEYKINWEVGVCDDNGNFVESFKEEAGVYELNAEKTAITLYADGLWDKRVPEDSDQWDTWFHIRATVTAGEEHVSDSFLHVDINHEELDYHFPVDDNINSLPYWDHGIDKHMTYYVKDAENPHGEERETTITSVTVVNAEDEEGDTDVVTVTRREDGNGWNLHMERYGHAVGTLTYITHDRKVAEKTFDIRVGSDVFELYAEHSYGVDLIIPGESIDLTAYFNHECYYEDQGHFQGSTEGVRYEWRIADDNVTEDQLSIQQDQKNPEILHVTAADNLDNENWNIPIEVRAFMPDDNGEMFEAAYHCFWLKITAGYQYMVPISLENSELAAGETLEVNPKVYERSYGKEDSIDVSDEVIFRFDWDKEAVEITDADGEVLTYEDNYGKAPFVFKKLQNWYTGVSIFAERADGDGNYYECASCYWDFQELNYDIWFENLREEGHTWIFRNDGDGEAYTIDLNTEHLQGDYEIDWEIGICNEKGIFEKILKEEEGVYQFNKDRNSVTLYANGLWNQLVPEASDQWDTWFNIRAIVKVNGEEVSRTDAGVQICPEELEYDFPVGDGIGLLPHWGFGFLDTFDYYMRNPEYPYGQEGTTKILDVKVENASDESNEDAVAVAYDRGGEWEIIAESCGHAICTITYLTNDDQIAEKVVDIWVGTDVYEVVLSTSSGTWNMLPGGEIDLIADVKYFHYDTETGEEIEKEPENLVYEWDLLDENCLNENIMTMKEDGNVLHIRANSENNSGWCIPIRVRVMKTNDQGESEEVASSQYDIWIHESYYQLVTEPLLGQPGEVLDVPAKLMLVTPEHPEGILMENVTYRVWEESAYLEANETAMTVKIVEDMVEAEQTPMSRPIIISAETVDSDGNHIYEEYTSTVTICVHNDEKTLVKAEIGKDGYENIVCQRCGRTTGRVISAVESVTASDSDYICNGSVQRPTITVKDREGNLLIAGTDYEVTYTDGCKEPGSYTAAVNLKGDYSGTKTFAFKIMPKSNTITSLKAEKKGFTAKWNQDTTVTGYEIQYSENSSFSKASTKTVANNTTASLKVTGLKSQDQYFVRIRSYKDAAENGKTIKLYSEWSDVITVITMDNKGKLSPMKSVKLSKTSDTYDGSVKKPGVEIKDKKGNILTENKDYKLTYAKGFINPGTYKITVKYIGDYSKLKKVTLTFSILPRATAVTGLTASKKGFKVKWEKSAGVTGYEIQYSTNKKLKKAKSVTASSTSKTVSKLSAKKTYYVRIRAYKKAKLNGKSVKLYSDWSKAKRVKIK